MLILALELECKLFELTSFAFEAEGLGIELLRFIDLFAVNAKLDVEDCNATPCDDDDDDDDDKASTCGAEPLRNSAGVTIFFPIPKPELDRGDEEDSKLVGELNLSSRGDWPIGVRTTYCRTKG